MSKRESSLTEGFWLSSASGALIAEYPSVLRGVDCGPRLADAVILPDEPHRRSTYREYPSLAGRNVIMVQTKASRMGMYLTGQALFSARLVLSSGAIFVRSILLCQAPDSALLPLLGPFSEVEVWVSDPAQRECGSPSIVVARRIKLLAGPTLVLNSNYNSTTVPAPGGLSPGYPYLSQ